MSDHSTKKLTLLHVHDPAIGYGRLGVHLSQALTEAGVDIYDGIRGPDEGNVAHQALEGDRHRRIGMTESVAWVSVPSHARGWYEGQHASVFTMWEATRLPESFREGLHNFETVVVPSEQNVELFSQYHDNVKLCLLGIDTERWAFSERKAPVHRFNYLIGGSGTRKGTDLAVRAFRRVWGQEGSWGSGPVPHLILKSPKPEDFYGNRIERVPGRISAEDEVDLYANAHVYLQPSRGEGFGLQPLQAIAQGCPTILTNAHGQASFAHYGIPLGYSMTPAGYFVYGDAGDWWEPDFDELCEAMFWTYHNYEAACAKARSSSVEVTERFTWANTATSFLDAIGRDHLGDYQGSGRWVQSSVQLFWVTTSRDWKCDVAGTDYLFRKGEPRLAPADVKRILWEANLLDLSHDDGEGLLPEQAAQMAEYQARNAYCPTCLQRFNSGVTRADEILAEQLVDLK